MRRIAAALPLVTTLLLTLPRVASGDEPPATIPITEGLAIGPCGTSARSAVHTDAVEEQIVRGTWKPPAAGDVVTLPDGTSKAWALAKAEPDGAFGDGVAMGGYLYARVTVPAERVMLLAASGHAMVYVDGEPRGGDPYSYGFLRLPVRLRKGDNDFLFAVSRGPLRARLETPPAPVFLSAADVTAPDAPEPSPGIPVPQRVPLGPVGVVVVNATTTPRADLVLRARRAGRGGVPLDTPVPAVPALGVRKVGVVIPSLGLGDTESIPFTAELSLLVGDAVASSIPLSIRTPGSNAPLVRTFTSDIDGSVQSYAVLPAGTRARGVVLTLHGASVEAKSQAAAYARKGDLTIVAPTNRRPFGFDWEDWGRLDALEVLRRARLEADGAIGPVFLTGHSMGGHGTWHLGVTFPDRWAAIAPSAGWRSFATYGGAPARSDDPVGAMLIRAASPSDTESLASNLATTPIYALHGDADDNVPVGEMRAMLETLKPFHRALRWHEQKGAGHWWDLPDTPGADCVDWPPIFELFRERLERPAPPTIDVDFTTMSPGVSARRSWATIVQQEHALGRSRVRLRWDAAARTLDGTTENVRLLAIGAGCVTPTVVGDQEPGRRLPGVGPVSSIRVRLDGANLGEVPTPQGSCGAIVLRRATDGWTVDSERPVTWEKHPGAYGPFKDAFQRGMLFVYGTHGSAEENAWAAGKARYDAETWYVRGNGAVDVIPDVDWKRNLSFRNTVLYGTAPSNSVAETLLADSPVAVAAGSVRLGARTAKGDDLACLFVRPSRVDTSLVAVIAGTGPAGRRLCDRIPIFVSGVGIPDVMVMRVDALSKGEKGLVAAGFFGPDWGVDTGDWAWRDGEAGAAK